MNYKQKRINYLFTTTKGLILINIAIISLVVALFGMLSGPLKEWGLGDLMVRFLGMDLQPQEREGRIIMLYHTIAIAFLSLLVYIITDIVKMKPEQVRNIRNTITVGYLMVVIFGLGFAYWGHNWSFHGLFLVGQTLVFYSGILLTIALWPWNKEYYDTESDYAHTKSGFPLERAAFWIMSVSTLGSAVFGAVAGASFGNGFETFLAENGVRHTHHSPLDLAVIGHLHIMLTLIGIATALIIGRWYDWKGILHKIGMWLFIIGTIIITLGVWAVVPYRLYAHAIIYVGAVFSMSGALMLVIFGWRKLMGFNSENKQVVGFVKRIKMLINDPLKFGSLWQMVFMNFTVSGVGIFMAIKLEKIFRVIPFREERITLTGHWHILAALTGTIVLMYLMSEVFPLKGKIRKITGWTIILGSDIAFAMVTLFSLKRLWVSEEAQEPIVKFYMILTEVGLGILEITLGIYMIWLLIKLINKKLLGMSLMLILGSIIISCGKPANEIHPSKIDMSLTVNPGEWVSVPSGEYLSGFNAHSVNIDYDFEIMKTEVTNFEFAQYLNEAFLNKNIYIKNNEVWGNYHGDEFHNGRHEKHVNNQDFQYYNLNGERARINYKDGYFSVEDGYYNFPVTYVSWPGAFAFANFYGWRLPLKHEWEKSARGINDQSYPFGNFELGPDNGPQYGNYHHSGDPFDDFNGLTPIGFYNGNKHGDFQTKDSKSPFGCYDMAGNVAEWTGDIVKGSHQRYIMGGSMMEYAFEMRSATENSGVPGFVDDEVGYVKPYMSFQVGFRCVRGKKGNIIESGSH